MLWSRRSTSKSINRSSCLLPTQHVGERNQIKADFIKTLRIGRAAQSPKGRAASQPVKPDDHSESVPPLPIPNRTVKRLSADDSADSRVKVGHRQANNKETPGRVIGRFSFGSLEMSAC